MLSTSYEWLLLASPFLFALLLIKLFPGRNSARSSSHKKDAIHTKGHRVEPSAALPDITVRQSISYQSKPFILTNAERIFYRTLQKSLSSRFLILMKVRVADVLEPEKGMDKNTWQSTFNRIKAKHFDFVLCSPNNFQIIAAIELDDSSQNNVHRNKPDEFLNSACESANFPLIRFCAKDQYVAKEVLEIVINCVREYRTQKAA